MKYCHGWLKFEWKSLDKWQYLQRYRLWCPMFLQRITNNTKCLFSVNDTTHAIYNKHGARQKGMMTLNILFSVTS